MLFPPSLNLNAKQKQLAANFVDRVNDEWKNTYAPEELEDEETSCMDSPFHFAVYTSGIGDNVFIVCGADREWLDDGLDP